MVNETTQEYNELEQEKQKAYSVYNRPIPKRRFGAGYNVSEEQRRVIENKKSALEFINKANKRQEELKEYEKTGTTSDEYERRKSVYEQAQKIYFKRKSGKKIPLDKQSEVDRLVIKMERNESVSDYYQEKKDKQEKASQKFSYEISQDTTYSDDLNQAISIDTRGKQGYSTPQGTIFLKTGEVLREYKLSPRETAKRELIINTGGLPKEERETNLYYSNSKNNFTDVETLNKPSYIEPLELPPTKKPLSKAFDYVAGEEGQKFIRLPNPSYLIYPKYTPKNLVLADIKRATIEGANKKGLAFLPVAVGAEFIPTTPLEVGLYAGSPLISKSKLLIGAGVGLSVGFGSATALNKDLPLSTRIAGGITAGLGLYGGYRTLKNTYQFNKLKNQDSIFYGTQKKNKVTLAVRQSTPKLSQDIAIQYKVKKYYPSSRLNDIKITDTTKPYYRIKGVYTATTYKTGTGKVLYVQKGKIPSGVIAKVKNDLYASQVKIKPEGSKIRTSPVGLVTSKDINFGKQKAILVLATDKFKVFQDVAFQNKYGFFSNKGIQLSSTRLRINKVNSGGIVFKQTSQKDLFKTFKGTTKTSLLKSFNSQVQEVNFKFAKPNKIISPSNIVNSLETPKPYMVGGKGIIVRPPTQTQISEDVYTPTVNIRSKVKTNLGNSFISTTNLNTGLINKQSLNLGESFKQPSKLKSVQSLTPKQIQTPAQALTPKQQQKQKQISPLKQISVAKTKKVIPPTRIIPIVPRSSLRPFKLSLSTIRRKGKKKKDEYFDENFALVEDLTSRTFGIKRVIKRKDLLKEAKRSIALGIRGIPVIK